MAVIQIVTTAEEQRKVLEAIGKLEKQTVALSTVAKEAKVSENRVRYIITDLLDAGKIVRIPMKALNKHYVRYAYELVR